VGRGRDCDRVGATLDIHGPAEARVQASKCRAACDDAAEDEALANTRDGGPSYATARHIPFLAGRPTFRRAGLSPRRAGAAQGES
jgi:hypothetical protein